MDWTTFIQGIIGIVILFIIGLVMYKSLNGDFTIKEEMILKRDQVYGSSRTVTYNERPIYELWYIKRTYQSGRVKYYTKKM